MKTASAIVAATRGALWAMRAIVSASWQLRRRRAIDAIRLPAPSGIRDPGLRGVGAVLAVTRSRCLMRALLVREWYAARGRALDLVIGVKAPSAGFAAHAWLEEAGAPASGAFVELLRSRRDAAAGDGDERAAGSDRFGEPRAPAPP